MWRVGLQMIVGGYILAVHQFMKEDESGRPDYGNTPVQKRSGSSQTQVSLFLFLANYTRLISCIVCGFFM